MISGDGEHNRRREAVELIADVGYSGNEIHDSIILLDAGNLVRVKGVRDEVGVETEGDKLIDLLIRRFLAAYPQTSLARAL